MITSLEFEAALKIISDYKIQLENNLNHKTASSEKTVNILNDIEDETTLRVLKNYYRSEFKIELKREDLSEMDFTLLASINYYKLEGFRGFGKVRLNNFKKLMVLHSVLDKEVLK